MQRVTQSGKAVLAGLLILWVFGAALLSSGRFLHEEVHHDSNHASHQCAISLFERGQNITPDPVCELVRIVTEPIAGSTAEVLAKFSSVSLLHQTDRGPPA